MAKYTFIHFPSTDEAQYDFYAIAPENMKKADALVLANRIIVQANHEDNENINAGGGTDSGLLVKEYIVAELGKLGFSFADEKPKLATTKAWDEYHGKPRKAAACNA